jgi:hypothetical protein
MFRQPSFSSLLLFYFARGGTTAWVIGKQTPRIGVLAQFLEIQIKADIEKQNPRDLKDR